MIVDCHTHIWQSPEQLGQLDLGELHRPSRPRATRFSPARTSWRTVPAADPDHHWAQSSTVDKSFVLGFKSRYLSAEIPNSYVAEYVNRFPQKLIGFAGIDPTERSALDELRAAREHLLLRGVTLSPAFRGGGSIFPQAPNRHRPAWSALARRDHLPPRQARQCLCRCKRTSIP